ncbi:MAG: hypothetical protein KDA78_16560, partial [Planctomycetaceae bacterium]|nr:hypothetical protein [Planctomycetaceae bacterium]
MVSPLPLDEYRKDFVDKSDREEFETLLKHDSHPTILNETTKNDWLNSEHRNQAYLDAGKKVVDLCEILIVVWDGLPARGKGGTGDIVEYALNQQRMTIWLDPNNPQQQPKLLVPDMESNNPLPGMKTSTLPEQIKYWSLGYHRYRAFVADPVVDKLTIERHCESTLGELETAGVDSGFPSQWSSYARGIATIMSQADLMAVAYQKKYLFAAKALYRLSAIAVTIAVFQILFYPQQIWMISFEIAAMLAAAGLFLYSRREAWHEKWLNDRYIAESLRSTIYHDLAIGKSKIATEPSNALPFYIGPDHWFFSAFRKILEQFPESMPKLDFNARKHFLIKHWIKSQANWHAGNAARKEKIVRKYEIFGFTCFCLTVVMAILHLIGIGHDAHATESDHKAAVVSNHHEEKTG